MSAHVTLLLTERKSRQSLELWKEETRSRTFLIGLRGKRGGSRGGCWLEERESARLAMLLETRNPGRVSTRSGNAVRLECEQAGDITLYLSGPLGREIGGIQLDPAQVERLAHALRA